MYRPRWQVEHLSIRLSALILAIILWFIAAGRSPRDLGANTRLISLPVAVVNVAPGLTVTEGPDDAQVWIDGPGLILMLQGNRVELYVDASGVVPGVHRLPVQVKAPSSLQVKNIEPAEVDVRLEAL